MRYIAVFVVERFGCSSVSSGELFLEIPKVYEKNITKNNKSIIPSEREIIFSDAQVKYVS